MRTQVLVVGAGTGGTAAALAAASMGCSVVLSEETWVVGGQLTAQAVPPDEHPWIEEYGCPRSYRKLRSAVRDWYRRHASGLDTRGPFNPGGGWVSRLCAVPAAWEEVLNDWIRAEPNITLLRRHKPFAATAQGDRITSVTLRDLESGSAAAIEADFVIDATELGDLLAIAGVEYVSGAESREETGEPNAVEGPPQPDNVQGLTWVFSMNMAGGSEPVRPAQYDKWRAWKPDFWPGPLLGFEVLHAHTGEPRILPLAGNPGYELFSYRQIVAEGTSISRLGIAEPATIVNWPQNDYFEASIIDVEETPQWDIDYPGATGPVSKSRLEDARQLSLSLLHWLQTEAPRSDGGAGYPECGLDLPSIGTPDGFAAYPYVRESRRIRAAFTLTESHVAAACHPGLNLAPGFGDSVGIGAYRIDLHPSTSGANTIDTSSLPYQLPLGCLIPERAENLLPAAKNLGVTHISNGCTRLHPVEWTIGEVAGRLAAACLKGSHTPRGIWESPSGLAEFQALLDEAGVERSWPDGRPL